MGNERRKRKAFDHETETFNSLSSPLNIDTEVKLRTLGVNLKKAIEAASQEKIDTSLSKQQSDGLRKLKERIKNREVVVFPTDKSGRFSIDTPENYIEAGRVHTMNDETISNQECLHIE